MRLTYKSLHGSGPKFITDMLPLHKPCRKLRSYETNLLIILIDYPPFYHLWNCMTTFLREALSVCLVYERCYINQVALPCLASTLQQVTQRSRRIDPLKMHHQDAIGPQYWHLLLVHSTDTSHWSTDDISLCWAVNSLTSGSCLK
jgi:hypothetical protein